jgi:hypothetical protein
MSMIDLLLLGTLAVWLLLLVPPSWLGPHASPLRQQLEAVARARWAGCEGQAQGDAAGASAPPVWTELDEAELAVMNLRLRQRRVSELIQALRAVWR